MKMSEDAHGMGRPLVLIPGLGCDGRMWGGVIDRLGEGYKIIVPRVWEADTIAQAAEITAETLSEAGGGPAFFAGLSFGGYVVLETLRRHPQSVKAAALLDTTAYPDDAHRREKRQQVLRLIAEGKFKEVREAFVRTVVWEGGARAALATEFISGMCAELGPKVYARTLTAIMERGSFEDVLTGTDKPLLFLAGEHDPLTPPALAEKMAAEAKNAQAYEITGAAHMTAVENPTATAYALASFFERFDGEEKRLPALTA